MIYYKINEQAEQQKWRPWFAWYPVKIKTMPDGHFKYAWLEKVLKCTLIVQHALYPYKITKFKETGK